VGAVIVQNGRALVVRRSTEPLMGEWSIPGGVLELGETLRQGAEREALEETGLTVEVGEVLEVFDRIVPDAEGKTRFHYVLIDFLCRPVAGELRPGGDAAEVRWISREELKTFAIAEPAAAVIRKALEAG
jgi:ADP-ribose pyrophosphatase YjhB (NUDIX family)